MIKRGVKIINPTKLEKKVSLIVKEAKSPNFYSVVNIVISINYV